jgi:hypothetical protein
MAERTPVDAQLLIADDAPTTPWADVNARLETPEANRTYWLATVRPDGRPHVMPNVMPILGLWLDGAFYFTTGETTRKGQNLAVTPQCVMAVSIQSLPSLDVIVEGEAVKVTDNAKVQRVADAYASTLHWPLTVHDGLVVGDGAPTAGPSPYAVFALTPTTVFGLPGLTGMDEEGEDQKAPIVPTRWRFSGSDDPGEK